MHRALIATAGTVVGLVALLGYKSSGSLRGSQVAVSPPTTPSPSTTPTTASPSTTTLAPRSFTGQDVQYRYGDIQIQVTMVGTRITQISIPRESATDSRSRSINSQAVRVLSREALAAQSLSFDVVSGATFTSDAFAQTLQTALGQAGK